MRFNSAKKTSLRRQKALKLKVLAKNKALTLEKMVVLKPVKIGVVGAGCIGQEHIKNLLLAPRDLCELVACADPDAAMMKEAETLLTKSKNVQLFASVEAMVEECEMEAVIVAVPNYKHLQVCETLLKNGEKTFHVLCEKPVATTLEDCERLVRLVSPDKVFAVGLEYRHIPPMRKLLERLPEVGKPLMVTIREHRFPFLKKVGLWNRDNAKSGGTLVEKGCHFFDFFRLCAAGSRPTTVYARGGQAANHWAPGVLDHAVVVVDFDDGLVCTLELSMFAEASKNQLEVSAVGAAGKIEAFAPAHGVHHDDANTPNFRLGRRKAMDWQERTTAPPESHTIGAVEESHVPIDNKLMAAGDHAGATYYELLEFAHACQGKPNKLASVYDATLSVAVGLAAQHSIATRQVVHLKDLLSDGLYDALLNNVSKTAPVPVNVAVPSSFPGGAASKSAAAVVLSTPQPVAVSADDDDDDTSDLYFQPPPSLL
mmetsp:Transcript_8846/g.27182  ORF Transcript_8846/g.27182 Transcript_8846/m.27182 type:complete len:484 (+) Transcript_8846:2201-3652(+)